jgi:predicted ATP-grasp superfamily ATP-dependent carboligase
MSRTISRRADVTNPKRLLIVGVSTRAAAESAARAGYRVTALDAFGDLDQHPAVRALSLPRDFERRFSATAASRAARTIESEAVAYVSSFENHPRAVSTVASGRELWGNPPSVLRRVRDPLAVSRALRMHHIPGPAVRLRPARQRTWLAKPLASGGGRGVRWWHRGDLVPRGCYLQEFVEGTPGSIVFLAAGGRAVPIGMSRQLVGEPAFGATGFKYCGSILGAAGDVQFARDRSLVSAARALADTIANEFGLVGVNGIDFVAHDGVPFAIEVNPRWTASVELVERAYGLPVFAAHAAACRIPVSKFRPAGLSARCLPPDATRSAATPHSSSAPSACTRISRRRVFASNEPDRDVLYHRQRGWQGALFSCSIEAVRLKVPILETFILIPGRTSKQGCGISEGKFADGYQHEITTLQVAPPDMKRLGLANGDRVRITTESGRQIDVAVTAAAGDELPPGLLFIAYGDLSSKLMDGDTHGSGMPTSKGFDVTLEKLS